MSELRFSLTCIFAVKGQNLGFPPYTAKYGTKKTRILAFFTQCVKYDNLIAFVMSHFKRGNIWLLKYQLNLKQIQKHGYF